MDFIPLFNEGGNAVKLIFKQTKINNSLKNSLKYNIAKK